MAKQINQWDIWLAEFPLEENPKNFTLRPAIVLNVEPFELLSLKVTKHEPRDEYDVNILKWRNAGLRYESTARISKTVRLSRSKFKYKLGVLDTVDRNNITNKFVNYINSKKLTSIKK